MRVELKVKPVTRYIVTKYTSEGTVESGVTVYSGGSVATIGEYDNPDVAHEVAYAIAKSEHDRLGYMPGDERIQYPQKTPKSNIVVDGFLTAREIKIDYTLHPEQVSQINKLIKEQMPRMIKEAKNRGIA